MRRLPEPRVVLEWGFLALGLFLVIRNDLVIDAALSWRFIAPRFFPGDLRAQNVALAIAVVAVTPAGLLFLLTAWSLRRGRRWSLWVGRLACISLLPAVPWFTLAGVAGLGVLAFTPLRLGAAASSAGSTGLAGSGAPPQEAGTEQAAKDDYWTALRKSKPHQAVFLLAGAFFGLAWIASVPFARRMGFPPYRLGWHWWLYLVPFCLANTVIHEAGHALAALALRHKIRVMAVGPVVLSKTDQGFSCRIRWDRMADPGGYVGSAPTRERHARLQEISVVAAGPLASLASALAALAVLFSISGTAWQNDWPLVVLYGVLAFEYAFISLIPAGYTDGNMLYHLIRWTPQGQLLVAKVTAALAKEPESPRGELPVSQGS